MWKFLDENLFWIGCLLIFVLIAASPMLSRYLEHQEKLAAIQAGLVQDKGGNWVKP